MYLDLKDELKNDKEAIEAQELIKDCVHCGFCLGTCPTYNVLGDELDSPRGRIYQIKNLLEGKADNAAVQQHLDRCLTCRACETTCPSGVKYGHLLEWGRNYLSKNKTRTLLQRTKLTAIRQVLSEPRVFKTLWKIGVMVKPLAPENYARKLKPAAMSVQTKGMDSKSLIDSNKEKSGLAVILHQGCVQNTLSPNINHATKRLLESWGVTVHLMQDGCCGAVSAHMDDEPYARRQARNNIETWGVLLAQQPKTTIVSNASGCGAQLKDYAHILRQDEQYAHQAKLIASAVHDISEVVMKILTESPVIFDQLKEKIKNLPEEVKQIAYHEPCTLQHGQKLKGSVNHLFEDLGIRFAPSVNTHLCCGSAGAYSITQPSLSKQLLDNKIRDLRMEHATCVLSANIGCISHIGGATHKPVVHWIEWVDAVWAGEVERVTF